MATIEDDFCDEELRREIDDFKKSMVELELKHDQLTKERQQRLVSFYRECELWMVKVIASIKGSQSVFATPRIGGISHNHAVGNQESPADAIDEYSKISRNDAEGDNGNDMKDEGLGDEKKIQQDEADKKILETNGGKVSSYAFNLFDEIPQVNFSYSVGCNSIKGIDRVGGHVEINEHFLQTRTNRDETELIEENIIQKEVDVDRGIDTPRNIFYPFDPGDMSSKYKRVEPTSDRFDQSFKRVKSVIINEEETEKFKAFAIVSSHGWYAFNEIFQSYMSDTSRNILIAKAKVHELAQGNEYEIDGVAQVHDLDQETRMELNEYDESELFDCFNWRRENKVPRLGSTIKYVYTTIAAHLQGGLPKDAMEMMIERTLLRLNEKGCFTEESIPKFIKREFDKLPWAHFILLKNHLSELLMSDKIRLVYGLHYLLPHWIRLKKKHCLDSVKEQNKKHEVEAQQINLKQKYVQFVEGKMKFDKPIDKFRRKALTPVEKIALGEEIPKVTGGQMEMIRKLSCAKLKAGWSALFTVFPSFHSHINNWEQISHDYTSIHASSLVDDDRLLGKISRKTWLVYQILMTVCCSPFPFDPGGVKFPVPHLIIPCFTLEERISGASATPLNGKWSTCQLTIVLGLMIIPSSNRFLTFSLRTWKDLHNCPSQFPAFNPRGQGLFYGEGIDTE